MKTGARGHSQSALAKQGGSHGAWLGHAPEARAEGSSRTHSEVTTSSLRILGTRMRQLRRGKYRALKPLVSTGLDGFPACCMGSVRFRTRLWRSIRYTPSLVITLDRTASVIRCASHHPPQVGLS